MENLIKRLKEGNGRFTATNPKIPVEKQEPFCAVLACADSRVSPEIVFQQGMGDLFVVRQAGNRATESAIESLRIGVERLHLKLIVVMGHQNCAAIDADKIEANVHEQVARLKGEFPEVEVVGCYFSFYDGAITFL